MSKAARWDKEVYEPTEGLYHIAVSGDGPSGL